MDKMQIDTLRGAVSRIDVYWHHEGAIRKVTSVPEKECDPDNTGVKDYIAILEGGGHVDLSNVDRCDFMVMQPFFVGCRDK